MVIWILFKAPTRCYDVRMCVSCKGRDSRSGKDEETRGNKGESLYHIDCPFLCHFFLSFFCKKWLDSLFFINLYILFVQSHNVDPSLEGKGITIPTTFKYLLHRYLSKNISIQNMTFDFYSWWKRNTHKETSAISHFLKSNTITAKHLWLCSAMEHHSSQAF